MPNETTMRLTLGTIIAALILVAGSLLWAGSITADVRQVRIEYGRVLEEVRELRKDVQDLRIQQARWMRDNTKKEQR